MQSIFWNRYILESCKKGTDKCDKNICDSAWQNINCPQLCVPVSRCLHWVAMLCWPWGQVAVTMRSWWTWHNVTLSGRVNISLSKISKQFTKPTAFTQPQEITFEAPSQKMPRLDRATRASRGNLSIFRVLWGGDGANCISLPSMIHQSLDWCWGCWHF